MPRCTPANYIELTSSSTYPIENGFMIRTTLTLLTFALGLQTSFALDWPQWRGPNRDGVSAELTITLADYNQLIY